MSVDTSGISTIGAAAVTTVGTLAVTGAALNAVNKTTSRMYGGRRGTHTVKKSNYKVFSGTKRRGSSNKMLGF